VVEESCASCSYWNQGAPENAMATRAIPEDPMIGTCEKYSPSIVSRPHYHGTFYPRTHATRCCGDWMPNYYHEDPDGGEEVPVPEGKVVAFGKRRA
jgi:hypothetical protein